MTSLHERALPLEQLMPMIRELLEQGQTVTFNPRGVSMLPMLRQGRDSVTLSPVTGRLSKYDLPLYRRDDGAYVLHRVVAVGETYSCMGDNQFLVETGVRDDQVIGLVTRFCRDGRTVPVTNLAYRMYCRLWHWSRPLRKYPTRVLRALRRRMIT